MALGLVVVLGGCGDEGVAEDATVSVYASAPLCAGAERELARSDRRAAGLRVRLVCLGSGGERWRTAAIAAGARRAAEDSSTVAYIGSADPIAIRFYRPILEEAGIASLATTSGATAMSQMLSALRRAAGSDSGVRKTVLDEL